ncbi:hypothetical protein V5739_00455 [Salinimicrobium sp. TIG7-5_MAKvit]|uniref:hypothetical protein n=1 Tax=Salinimicrobium sp. TIG7-5_MAKvit TaxID=3121289 RepID=UPI003C6E567E
MTIEKIIGISSRRTWFDSPSDEFNRTDMEKKIKVLASLNYWGLLDKVIADYQEKYKDKDYIQNSLKSTLLLYINELDEEGWHNLRKQRLSQTISSLKELLREKVEINFSANGLVEAYLTKDKEEFEKQNRFFRVDFEEDITTKLEDRDKRENRSFQESYTHLYSFFKNVLLPKYRKEDYSPIPVDMGMDYQMEYVVSHFLLNDPNRENYSRALSYTIRVLLLNYPPYHDFFIFRINLHDPIAIKDFWKKNEVAIHFNTEQDMEDWGKLKAGEQPEQLYVQRWVQLQNELEKRDVIICASYKGLGYKMGVIRRSQEPAIKKSTEGFYAILPLEKSKEIDLDLHPVLQGLLPSNVTISRIKKRNYRLRKLYHQMKVKLPVREFDSNSYEIMVNEWLRSSHAPEEIRMKFQLLKTGSNKKDIDIFGVSVLGEKMAVQVSDTNDPRTIMRKVRQLSNYEEFKKLFFFNINSSKEEDVEIIDLKQVVSDLENDNSYQELVQELS